MTRIMNKAYFNENNRTSNSLKTSIWGTIKSCLDILLGFIYRTVFISILSAEYLGLNGLFTNVLQVLSLAELGITTAIVYRFYKPIGNGDYIQVGKLMNYLKKVYRYIATFILVAGLFLTPFLNYLISYDTAIPLEVNLYLVYLLFLINTISSYLFAYRQTIISADQRGYIVAVIGIVTSVIKYALQIFILYTVKDYTSALFAGIIINLVSNYAFSCWVTKKYYDVFAIKEELSKDEKKEIINDTKAVMFHKIGATVKLSTDSIILSKFVNLASTGIYSNYSMIISGLQTIMGQLLGSFVSSIGNAHFKLSIDESYEIYNKLLFIDLWFSTVIGVCSYLLLNDFIILWIGRDYLFDKATLIMLCLQFYLLITRQINISYTNGCGLFLKDRYRPIIEVIINLVLSIIGVVKWGIVGVFIGTVFSSVLTVFWREPYILFKEEFQKPVKNYWRVFTEFFLISIILCIIGDFLKRTFIVDSFGILFVEAVISFITTNCLLLFIYGKTEEYTYMKKLCIKIFNRLKDFLVCFCKIGGHS